MRFVKTAASGYGRNGDAQGSGTATINRREVKALAGTGIPRTEAEAIEKRGSRGEGTARIKRTEVEAIENRDSEGSGTATINKQRRRNGRRQ